MVDVGLGARERCEQERDAADGTEPMSRGNAEGHEWRDDTRQSPGCAFRFVKKCERPPSEYCSSTRGDGLKEAAPWTPIVGKGYPCGAQPALTAKTVRQPQGADGPELDP